MMLLLKRKKNAKMCISKKACVYSYYSSENEHKLERSLIMHDINVSTYNDKYNFVLINGGRCF